DVEDRPGDVSRNQPVGPRACSRVPGWVHGRGVHMGPAPGVTIDASAHERRCRTRSRSNSTSTAVGWLGAGAAVLPASVSPWGSDTFGASKHEADQLGVRRTQIGQCRVNTGFPGSLLKRAEAGCAVLES